MGQVRSHDLRAFEVVGDCQVPVINSGDVVVINESLSLNRGDYVVYQGGVWLYRQCSGGRPTLSNNLGSCIIDRRYPASVIVAVIKRLRE